MNKIPRLAVCCAITAAIALGGCGSSKSSGLSQSQLAAKADAACSAYATAARAIPQPKDFLTNPVSAAAYLDKLKPLVDTREKALLALKPNSTAKPVWDQFVAAGARATALFNDADAKAHAKNRAGISDLAQASSLTTSRIHPLARQLGATSCAK